MALNIREQELVILRMAFLYKSDYVWRHHVLVGRGYDITPIQLFELKRQDHYDDLYACFSNRERSLLVNRRSVRRVVWDHECY
jgi:alkylhydroperoxidase family enzyme